MSQQLKSLCAVLSNIHPGRDNKVEWAHIRSQSSHIMHHCSPNTFDHHLILLLQTFGNIKPGSSNCVEWHSIRGVCNGLLSTFHNGNHFDIFTNLLCHLTTIYPGHDNISEWNAIRSTSTNTLASLALFIQTNKQRQNDKELAELKEKNERLEQQRKASELATKEALLHTQDLLLNTTREQLRPLEQEMKDVQQQIAIQNQMHYPMQGVQYDAHTKFIVTFGITGDGKSTLCNRLCGDDSKKGNKGPFKALRSGDSVTVKIAYKPCTLSHNKCIIVDCPGCDDSKHHDVHHANNLAKFLCGINGVDAFILVQNGTNIRFKASLQKMIDDYVNNFGADAFWSHLVIVLTNIEPHLLDDDDDDDDGGLQGMKGEFVAKLNEKFKQSKKYKIPVLNIGWFGYDFNQWRCAFIRRINRGIKPQKVICDKMIPPIKKLLDRKGKLQQNITKHQQKVREIAESIANLRKEIEILKQ
eukprot:150004_1